MRARMRDEDRHAERLASIQLVDKSLDRLEPHSFIGRAEIDQVGVVRDHGRDAGFDLIAFERFDFLFAVRLRRPLSRRLGENLDAFAADLLAAGQRLADFSGDRHMRAKDWTAGFAGVCHREMPPLRAGLSRTRAHRDFIRKDAQSERPGTRATALARDAHRWILHYSCEPRSSYGLTLAAAGCAHVVSLPPQVHTLGSGAVGPRRQAARLRHAGVAA